MPNIVARVRQASVRQASVLLFHNKNNRIYYIVPDQRQIKISTDVCSYY